MQNENLQVVMNIVRYQLAQMVLDVMVKNGERNQDYMHEHLHKLKTELKLQDIVIEE